MQQEKIAMTVENLIERLESETGCSGLSNHLRELMSTDALLVEDIKIKEELIEGGAWDYEKDDWETPPVYFIESFIIYTEDYVYHSSGINGMPDAPLYEEVGTVFKVPRNP